jgi:hypothetical protein
MKAFLEQVGVAKVGCLPIRKVGKDTWESHRLRFAEQSFLPIIPNPQLLLEATSTLLCQGLLRHSFLIPLTHTDSL